MIEVYKVVMNKNGVLESAIINHGEWKVLYPPNKWAMPHVKRSKLTCFDTLDHATAFVLSLSGTEFEIWRADALHAEKAYYLADFGFPLSFGFDKFWKHLNEILLWREGKLPRPPLELTMIIEPPLGTLYADGLRLTNKIDLEILREK